MIAVLVGLLIKSGLVAGAGLALASLPGFRCAKDRVDILRAAVCLLIALPLLAAFGPDISLRLLPAQTVETIGAETLWTGDLGPVSDVSVSSAGLAPSAVIIGALVWAAVAAAILARFAMGVWALGRWTREARPVTAAAWVGPLSAVPEQRRPDLRTSTAIGAPLSWGLPPGVVLLDQATLNRPETARAVMAHELAHIRRRDWLFLGLSRLALALFWFNPLVWGLHAALAARTEDAADAAALAEVDPPTYARTLVSLAAGYGQPAALGITGPARSLARRITRIMKSERPAASRPALIAIAVVGLAVVATPLAAIELTPRVFAIGGVEGDRPVPPAPPAPPRPPAPAPLAPPAPPAPPASAAAAPEAPQAPEPPQAAEAPQAPQAPRAWRGDRVVRYSDLTPAEQRDVDRALEDAAVALRQAGEARGQAEGARVEAARVREQVQVAWADAARAREDADDVRVNARALAAEAQVQARAARASAAEARVQAAAAREQAYQGMLEGAVHMERGAREMRAEAERLKNPAYRARQIERSRERGDVVTDAELRNLSDRLPGRALQMEADARRMRASANSRG